MFGKRIRETVHRKRGIRLHGDRLDRFAADRKDRGDRFETGRLRQRCGSNSKKNEGCNNVLKSIQDRSWFRGDPKDKVVLRTAAKRRCCVMVTGRLWTLRVPRVVLNPWEQHGLSTTRGTRPVK